MDIRDLTSASFTESVFVLPEDCSRKLRVIVNRHRQFMEAKASGQLGVRLETLDGLEKQTVSVNDDNTSCCSICLEQLVGGDRVVKLPCGHIFHSGNGEEGEGRKKRRRVGDHCKGILYWFSANNSCPHCRYKFPTQIEEPSESEAVLIPLLHRQNRVLSRQLEVIKAQKKELDELRTKKLASEPLKIPIQSWQRAPTDNQAQIRAQVLEKITQIVLNDIIIRDSQQISCDDTTKNVRLRDLAAKVEYILFCVSPSFQVYSDFANLRERTLNTIKDLATKARLLMNSDSLEGSIFR